ncbi:MAG: hypothetical protein RMM51_01110 [Verrucomicrobiae bacterium]|nr:hypothetical protein [Verrucomicrobiae bacterium]
MLRPVGILLAMLVVLPWARGVVGERDPVEVEAERLTFAEQDGQRITVAEGNVVVRYRETTVQADRVRYNAATREVWAEGQVRLTREGQQWVSDSIYYNFATGAVRADEVRGWVEGVYLRGYGLEHSETNVYQLARATVTTCDYETPHYRLEARRAEIFPDQQVILYGVTLRLGEIPVFWFPVLVWAPDSDTPPFAISVGSSSRWGVFALTSTRLRLTRDATMTVHVDGRTKRGAAGGVDVSYRLGPTGRGLVRGYYAQDADPDDRLDQLAGQKLSHHRYRAQWQHQQDWRTWWAGEVPGHDLSVKIDLHKLSDADVVDDFFPSEFRREVEPQSVVDVTKRGENYTVSVLARPQFNHFFAEVERLPEATWRVNRTRLGETPVFYEQVSRVGYLNAEEGDTGDVLFRGHAVRAFTFHQLLVPLRWFGWLSVVPRAGMGGAYYSKAVPGSGEDDVRRALHHVGIETSFKLSRTWHDVDNKRWEVNGLRHVVQPFANYHWLPRSDNRTNELWQFDTVRLVTLEGGDRLLTSRYMPVEIPSWNAVDAIDRQHFVRFGLRQKLQTRRDEQTWDLVELEGWTDWRLEREQGEEEFNDVFGTVRLRPTRWLWLDAFTRYNLEEDRFKELNTSARVSHGDRWAVGLANRYLWEDSNLIIADVAVRLARRWVLQVYQRVDMHDGEWESQDYVLRQETHDWLISYGFRHRSQRVRDDEFAVYFAVTLKAFPQVGISINQVDLGVN